MQNIDLDAVRAELAPSGTLFCALNHGNVVLVRRGPTDDTPSGVSVDLARTLAAALEVPIMFRHYDKAGAVSASAGTGEWSVCFLAIDPERTKVIAYSEPYVQIEGAFLLREGIAAQSGSDIDKLQLRIGAVSGSAYELYLSRNGGAGKLARFDNFSEAEAALQRQDIDGLAGVRQAMNQFAARHAGYRVLSEPFMAIPQAVGVSVTHKLGADFVARFVRKMKADGFVRRSLDQSGHADVVVPANQSGI